MFAWMAERWNSIKTQGHAHCAFQENRNANNTGARNHKTTYIQ